MTATRSHFRKPAASTTSAACTRTWSARSSSRRDDDPNDLPSPVVRPSRKRPISLAKPQAIPTRGVWIVPPERRDTKEPSLRDGDRRKLFDSVFMAHVDEAFRLARWVTGNGADAEDVVQDAALRAYRAIASFAGVNARAWTLTVVRNTAYSWLAKNRPQAVVFTADLDADQQEALERPPLDGAGGETPERLLIDKLNMGAVRA